ncbi:hypothetical protein V7S43_016903 [Phytophthora oleae]|uniref:PX domain-containing protein n=1 Tax=Phytophthora oleae TaxID=2107226 RepID=A0ABD3EY33_9STRA
MNPATHSLSASITSALALKPSTVYILRVENTKTRKSWHIRRCFSEFCELREKLLSLIDDQMATYLTSPDLDSTENSFTSSSSVSSSVSTSGSVSKHHHSAVPSCDRFAYVFKQFPPRKLFGSRSKRVIEARSMALNRFLQQSLEVVEVVRQRQLIAICFSMMTHIETFLDCRAHREVARLGPSSSIDSRAQRSGRTGTTSPNAARRASAAVSLTPGFHHYPLVPSPAFTMIQTERFQSRYDLSDEETDSDDTQRFNNFDFTRRFYREFGRQEERAEIYSEDSDDEEMQNLKKTWSAMMESDTRERKLHHTGSHFSMLESGHSAPETWAKRVEIAGIHSTAKPESEVNAQKTSETRTEQLLHRHRSNYRLPVQNYL